MFETMITTNHFHNYLAHVEKKYWEFRYLSDRYSLLSELPQKGKTVQWIENNDGYALLFQDSLFPQEICFFGYLEIIGSTQKFLYHLQKSAKEWWCQRLIWPVNFSFWNQYRIAWSDMPLTIPWEYETDAMMHQWLIENWFQISEEFLTVYRDGTNPFTHFDADTTVSIREVTGDESMQNIYQLSCDIFENSMSIPYEEFLVYMRVYRELYAQSSHIFVLQKDQEDIGFLSSFFGHDFFVIKTFGIKKEFRRNGYGNMLLDFTFKYYFAREKMKSYGLYMRKTGDVMHMSHGGGSIFREYFTYSSMLSWIS